MWRTHFDPYPDPPDINPFCGTPVGDNSEVSTDWKHVDCKKCLKLRTKADNFVKETEALIVKDMGGMVDFLHEVS